jgi:hypothetical protein
MTHLWINGDEYHMAQGDVGFLISVVSQTGEGRHVLREHPALTNQSREPRLRGWLGTTNNVARYGQGLARITEISLGGRFRVERLNAEDTDAALKELGHPELAPELGKPD